MSDWIRDKLPNDYAPYQALKATNEKLLNDIDNYSLWIELVEGSEKLEDPLNRNSDPASIEAFRIVHNTFLAKYPLFYGYWTRFARAEFNIAGTESAEVIYERAIACLPASTHTWVKYCAFKVETTVTDPDQVRELFERAAAAQGASFTSEEFWDEYIKFEDREGQPDRVFAILERVIHIPMADYARFFERFRRECGNRPVDMLLLPEGLLETWRQEYDRLCAENGYTPVDIEIEREMRARSEYFYNEVYYRTQAETLKRQSFEQKLQRFYYLVDPMEEQELQIWERYLDFEEAEGDYNRIKNLYERCLYPCANYDKFWLRYARWMTGQSTNGEDEAKDIIIDENVRSIYARAACYYVPISRPNLRMHWAKYEESKGRFAVANDIHESVLMAIKNIPAVVTSWAHLKRRELGLDAAVELLTNFILNQDYDYYGKGWLVAEWAKMLWKFKGDAGECRQVFINNADTYPMVAKYWIDWVRFEINQPTTPDTRQEQFERIKQLIEHIRQKCTFSPSIIQDLTDDYLEYLEIHGTGSTAMKEWILLDTDTHGPMSVQHTHKKKLAINGEEATTDRQRFAENGHPGVAVNDAEIKRGVNPYAALYQDQGENPATYNQPLKYTHQGLQ